MHFAKYFTEQGWEVVTFYANYKGKENTPLFDKQKHDGLDFVSVRAPHYVGNGLARMKSIYTFSRTVRKKSKLFDRPDVVLHNIHPPFDYPIVTMAKKLGAKYIAEAWDLWPEDFVTFGLMKASNPAMQLAYAIEKRFYYKADEIVFTFLGAFDYLKRQGWMKEQGGKINPAHLHYINNGIDLEQFDQHKTAFPRNDADMNDDALYRIVYLGSINRANNVKMLIDAATLLKDNPKYRFFIYGNGTFRDELERYVADNKIDNVVFKERHISFAECAWVVSRSTVGIMNYEKGFGRWGVSSGKMFQYLAAGRPIVCNVDIAYDNLIEDNHLGVARDIETPQEFAKAIQSIVELPKEEYDAMCKRVRKTCERFDYKVLAEEELKVLNN